MPATVRCRDVFDADDPSVAFIGFVRPGVGAIPPIAEMQAQLWTLVLRGQIPPPLSTPHYYLLVKENARIKYGVDYSSYVSTLARDMGTAPPLGELLWTYGLKVTLIYCFGAAFRRSTVSSSGVQASRCEAHCGDRDLRYDQTPRVVGNLMMGLIPMLFYAWINLVALVAETGWRIVSVLRRDRRTRLRRPPGVGSRATFTRTALRQSWPGGKECGEQERANAAVVCAVCRHACCGRAGGGGEIPRSATLDLCGAAPTSTAIWPPRQPTSSRPRGKSSHLVHVRYSTLESVSRLTLLWGLRPVLHARAQPSLFGLTLTVRARRLQREPGWY